MTICDAFLRDPTRNPRTGWKIKHGGPTYMSLMRECAGLPTVQLPTVQLPTVQLPPTYRPQLPTVQLPTVQLPTVQLPPIYPKVQVPPVYPTVQVPPVYPTVQVPTVYPTVQVPSVYPTVQVPYPTVPPVYRPQSPTVQLPPVYRPQSPTVQVPTPYPKVQVPTVGPVIDFEKGRVLFDDHGPVGPTEHPMITVGHGMYKTAPIAPPSYPMQVPSPVNTMIEETIIEGEMDTPDKEYLNYVEFLLHGNVKYDLFAKIFPNHTCPKTALYMHDRRKGVFVWPDERTFVNCVDSKLRAGYPVAINMVIPGHASLVWIDGKNKTIDMYDSAMDRTTMKSIYRDQDLRILMSRLYPDFRYNGNQATGVEQCVQTARKQEKRLFKGIGQEITSDWFCQDYSLLYALLRIRGYSNDAASRALVGRKDEILQDITELMRLLVYHARLEAGKDPLITPPDIQRIIPT